MMVHRQELYETLYCRRGVRYILNLADGEREMHGQTYPIPEDRIENVPYDPKVCQGSHLCMLRNDVLAPSGLGAHS